MKEIEPEFNSSSVTHKFILLVRTDPLKNVRSCGSVPALRVAYGGKDCATLSERRIVFCYAVAVGYILESQIEKEA